MDIVNILIFTILIIWMVVRLYKSYRIRKDFKKFERDLSLVDKGKTRYKRIVDSKDVLPDVNNAHPLSLKLSPDIYDQALILAKNLLSVPDLYRFTILRGYGQPNKPESEIILGFIDQNMPLEVVIFYKYLKELDKYKLELKTNLFKKAPEEFSKYKKYQFEEIKINRELAEIIAEKQALKDDFSPTLYQTTLTSDQRGLLWHVSSYFNKTGIPTIDRIYLVDAITGEITNDDVGIDFDYQ